MVRMQIVVAGGAIRQAVAIDVGLPDRVGAPQTLLRRLGVEAVGLGEGSLAVRFCQQAGVAVQEVGGGCAAGSTSRCFADPSPRRVVCPCGVKLTLVSAGAAALKGVVRGYWMSWLSAL